MEDGHHGHRGGVAGEDVVVVRVRVYLRDSRVHHSTEDGASRPVPALHGDRDAPSDALLLAEDMFHPAHHDGACSDVLEVLEGLHLVDNFHYRSLTVVVVVVVAEVGTSCFAGNCDDLLPKFPDHFHHHHHPAAWRDVAVGHGNSSLSPFHCHFPRADSVPRDFQRHQPHNHDRHHHSSTWNFHCHHQGRTNDGDRSTR